MMNILNGIIAQKKQSIIKERREKKKKSQFNFNLKYIIFND